MIIGIGMDLCDISRMEKLLSDGRFLARFFSAEEQAYIRDKGRRAAETMAGIYAAKEALAKADERLLEPMMKVEAIVPDQYLGDVVGDINSRRGRIDNIESRLGEQSVHCFVPLSEMFGYATDLRSRTQGRGMYTMQFDHYEEVPKSVAEKVVGKR